MPDVSPPATFDHPLGGPGQPRPDFGPGPINTASGALGHGFEIVGLPGNADVPGQNNVPVTNLPRDQINRNATTPKFYPAKPG